MTAASFVPKLILVSLWLGVASIALASDPASLLRYYYPLPKADPPRTFTADVCVYGATPGGVSAAIQAARMGKKVILAEFGTHVGGITSGGLTATDGGEIAGGIGREFYNAVGKSKFRPGAAEAQFRQMLNTAKVELLTEQRLMEVKMEGGRITEIKMENGNAFRAPIFIDATYEGDLLALAGVSYFVGREANDVYHETADGIYVGPGHNFKVPVDPYVVPGNPKSGLLPTISAEPLGKIGDGDGRVQAYNFRMYFERGGRPFPKPAGYDAGRYALLIRYIAAGGTWGLNPHPGDVNNDGAFSTDDIGASNDWPDGPHGDVSVPAVVKRWTDKNPESQTSFSLALYARRERIYQEHLTYQQGLCYFLANDPSVPAEIQAKMKIWGLTRTDFVETGGWPYLLYVREGRRMMSDYVMTEQNCLGTKMAPDSVGLARYTMDSHNCRRLVVDGKVINEGNVQERTPHPYPISYRSIVPKETECSNLLVPVAISSSHLGYGSIRMEAVLMVLGQSAGTAAALALDAHRPVQQIDYAILRARLLQDKQLLDWNDETRMEIQKNLPEKKSPPASSTSPSKI